MFKKITLDNGLRIVSEKIPHVRSVSIGIWISTGSRCENSINNGISHFIEHMLFKGTSSRSAKEIAECIDNIGGQINAFTGKECTCYYTKTLDTHIEIAVDILADIMFNSIFAKKDIEIEKKVILEEIGMYKDTPEELVHEILSEIVWKGDSLGYPILGTQDTLKNFNREVVLEYLFKNYTPQNSVIAVAGNFEDNELIEIIKKKFGSWEKRKPEIIEFKKAEFVSNCKIKEKDTEQVHLCMGFDGIEHGNDELYTLLAVNNIFGGGMSSRLFQKIREEKGMAYSIYSYPSSYKNAGLFTIYAGMNQEHVINVSQMIIEEINELRKNGITQSDLEKSKEQLKGNFILGLESTSSIMNSIGKSELMLNKIISTEEVLNKINEIKLENVDNIISRVFNLDKISFSIVGNIKKDIDLYELLK